MSHHYLEDESSPKKRVTRDENLPVKRSPYVDWESFEHSVKGGQALVAAIGHISSLLENLKAMIDNVEERVRELEDKELGGDGSLDLDS